MNTEARIEKILAEAHAVELKHSCPESGYSCPGCDEREKLKYQINHDQYACGACGLVSTVNEVVEHSRELRRKGDTKLANTMLGTEPIEQRGLPKLSGKLKFHGSNVTLRPLFDRILIKPDPLPKETTSGLVIPDSAKPENKIREGRVLAVGPGDRMPDGTRFKPFCRPGDRVKYTSNPNQDWETELDGEKVTLSVINEQQFLYGILD